MKHYKDLVIVSLFSLFINGCVEELPLRNDPSNILTGNLSNMYLYDHRNNGIYIILNIVNNYDETISGEAVFDGTLQLEWIISRDLVGNLVTTRKVKLSSADIIRIKNYNTIRNELIFDSHDTLKLGYLWDFKFDDGTDARTVRAFYDGQKDIGCPSNTSLHVVYPNHEFKVNCNFQLFKKLSVVYFPELTINSCSINFYAPSPCDGPRPGSGESPCVLR